VNVDLIISPLMTDSDLVWKMNSSESLKFAHIWTLSSLSSASISF